MLKIGEFSRLSQVSVRMLRHYDKLRLLRPVRVDDDSGYRYYAPEQLTELNRLLALKDLGFSLEEIRRLMRGGLSPEEVVGMLKSRHTDLRKEIEDRNTRLRRVETRISAMEKRGEITPSYDIIVKRVEPVRVASIRARLPDYVDVSALWSPMRDFLGMHGISPGAKHFYVYHDPEYHEKDVDTELAVPVPKGVVGDGRVTVGVLPGLTCAAATVHRGAVGEVYGGYAALGIWISANGYQISGPNRLVVLQRDTPPEEHVTEVIWPVQIIPVPFEK